MVLFAQNKSERRRQCISRSGPEIHHNYKAFSASRDKKKSGIVRFLKAAICWGISGPAPHTAMVANFTQSCTKCSDRMFHDVTDSRSLQQISRGKLQALIPLFSSGVWEVESGKIPHNKKLLKVRIRLAWNGLHMIFFYRSASKIKHVKYSTQSHTSGPLKQLPRILHKKPDSGEILQPSNAFSTLLHDFHRFSRHHAISSRVLFSSSDWLELSYDTINCLTQSWQIGIVKKGKKCLITRFTLTGD